MVGDGKAALSSVSEGDLLGGSDIIMVEERLRGDVDLCFPYAWLGVVSSSVDALAVSGSTGGDEGARGTMLRTRIQALAIACL